MFRAFFEAQGGGGSNFRGIRRASDAGFMFSGAVLYVIGQK